MFIISIGISYYFINKVYFEVFLLIQVSILFLLMKYLMYNDFEVIWLKIEKKLFNDICIDKCLV